MDKGSGLAQRSYITQLDALRFFAAFITAVFHGDVIKMLYKAPDWPRGRNLEHWGANCVTMFFVLSGFLITWLLLKEKDKTGTVDVRAFYLRRVFRIWPLYYLILVSGLFVLPYIPVLFLPARAMTQLSQLSLSDILLWFTFFPNLSKTGFMEEQLLPGHTWSIGMEEQFYAIWPWVVLLAARPQRAMVGVILGFLVLRWGVYPFFETDSFSRYLESFRFDSMVIGGWLAWYFHTQKTGWLYRLAVRPEALYTAAALSLVLTLLPSPIHKTYYVPLISSLYGFLLLSLSVQPTQMQGLNHPALRYLGRISYGIYMYNVLACILAINIVQRMGQGTLHLFKDSFWPTNILYYALCVGLTIGMAAISYRYLEAPFLRWKDRYLQPKGLGTAPTPAEA